MSDSQSKPAVATAGQAPSPSIVPSASATSALRRTFHATLGAGAHYGSVTILAYMAGDALSQTTLQHLKPDATYSVRIYAGACNRLGPLARTLPSMRTDASGSATRTLAISAGKMNNVWGYVRSQPVVIRFVSGSSVVCGRLSFPVVTRVVISAYKIDLAVVEPPGSTARFPYCNVAEYFEALSQPGEPGVTLLFAHARTGMFLPLLTKSKVANGALAGDAPKVTLAWRTPCTAMAPMVIPAIIPQTNSG